MKLRAYSKINTYLDITGIADNGYHILDMVMNSIDIYDEISLKKTTSPSSVIMLNRDGKEFHIDKERNTVWKAVKVFYENFAAETAGYGVDIIVNKNIPEGAGLGGSSADPAGVLYGLGKLFNVESDRYMSLAQKIGSDVPFMLIGGRANVTGMGEIVQKLPYVKLSGIIVKPKEGVNTALCYAKYDEMEIKKTDYCGKIVDKIKGDRLEISSRFYNALSIPAMKLNSQIKEIYDLLINFDVIAVMMTGSGSAVFALTDSRENAEILAKKIPMGYVSTVFETTKQGVEEILF